MDYKEKVNKAALKTEITKLADEYRVMLHDFADGSDSDYHKAAILYYWLKEYKVLLLREPRFVPRYLKAYKRGDIVQINFGFNLGDEYGGKHYAVVVEDNDRSSGIVTVIPLRSSKPKDSAGIHRYELSLGTELFVQFNAKISEETANIVASTEEIKSQIARLEENQKNIEEVFVAVGDKENISEKLQSLRENTNDGIRELQTKLNNGTQKMDSLENCLRQFSKMKSGSVALIKQITTVSKLRIVNPCNDNDALAGIKLSPRMLNAIDQKILEFYSYK